MKVTALPTVNSQWGREFVNAAGFRADASTSAAMLRETFKFTDPPYGVVLEHGWQVTPLPFPDAAAYEDQLEKLGWIC